MAGLNDHLVRKHLSSVPALADHMMNSHAKKQELARTANEASSSEPSISPSRQPTLTELFERTPISYHQQFEFSKLAFQWLTTSLVPMSVLDDPAFKLMIAKAEPRLKVPNTKSYSDWLIVQSKLIDHQLAALCKSAQGFSFTCDFWSKFNRSFLGITAHYIDQSEAIWTMKRFFLALIPFDRTHSAEETDKAVMRAVKEKIGNKIYARSHCMTTDNGSNVKKFASESKHFVWISCFAHSLQLLIRFGLQHPNITKLLVMSKVKTMADKFKNSAEYKRRLQMACNTLGKNFTTIKFENDTRWSSFLIMIDSLIQQKEAIRNVFNHWAEDAPEKDDEGLSPSEWRDIVELQPLLQQFHQMSEAVQASKSPTISHVRYFIETIKVLIQPLTTDRGLTKRLKTLWRAAFPKKFAPYFSQGSYRTRDR